MTNDQPAYGIDPDAIYAIRPLAASYHTARRSFSEHYQTKPQTLDLCNEEHIRWQIKSTQLCDETVRLERKYRVACDELFGARP